MKLLYSADLHAPGDEGPYRRLAIFAEENGCALVVVAGDLLDLFSGGHPGSQIYSAAIGWLKTLSDKVPHLAVCSGNHDPDGPEGAGWLTRSAAAMRAGHLVVDGDSAVLPGTGPGDPGLVVTCCPHWNIQERGATHHAWLRERAAAVWAEGRWLADVHPALPWIVLHHEPPEGARVTAGGWEADGGVGSGAFWCAEWCRQFRPDYLLCGHLHQGPFLAGGAWADRVAGSPTWAFNPGRDRQGSRPIEIDTGSRLARWLTWDGEETEHRRVEAPC